MNTWHLKPKSCQWSKNVNAERSRHYSDSNPLCSEHKTTLQGLSTVHLECTAYVTRDREKLDLRETGVMWWLLILLTPSASSLTNKSSPCGWESFENKISEVCDRFAKERIVRKFGSIHTSNYIGVKKIWLNESLPSLVLQSLLLTRTNKFYEGNKIEWKDKFSLCMENVRAGRQHWGDFTSHTSLLYTSKSMSFCF